MLHILFLILKIIGIILLVILGITLTLVGVVLLVPIRYRMKTETTNGMKGLRTEVKANWFLHLISAHITYQEEKLDWQVRVGWKKFQATEEDDRIDDDGNRAEVKEENNAHADTPEQLKRATETASKKASASGTQSAKKCDDASGKRATSKQKKEGCLKKIKCTIREFCDKIKNIKEFLLEETYIQAFLRLKKEIIFFVRKIKPDKINGYLRIGLEDPYNTGRVLAVLSVLYPFYGEHFQVYPEFEQEIIEGDVFFKGRIHLIHLILVLGRAYFDKDMKPFRAKLNFMKRT